MADPVKCAIVAAHAAAVAQADRLGRAATADASKAENVLARRGVLLVVAAAAFVAGVTFALLL